jgi:hypothetical protein
MGRVERHFDRHISAETSVPTTPAMSTLKMSVDTLAETRSTVERHFDRHISAETSVPTTPAMSTLKMSVDTLAETRSTSRCLNQPL